MPCLRPLSRANAEAMLLITQQIDAGTEPSWVRSMSACRLVPLPEARTPTFNTLFVVGSQADEFDIFLAHFALRHLTDDACMFVKP